MRLTPSDPDVETLIGRMEAESIDLQPDFQRGEIWSTAKKQRLIDSILRDWHVPPVHVIVEPITNRQLVLDGQQRLVAIRDFARGEFGVDGHIEPKNPALAALHGTRYSALPKEWRNRFDQFTIRVFRITDYQPSEPGELFYRLNQPTALTAAEQRNAYFGDTRNQIKLLVAQMGKYQLGEEFWGFSNARMSYDDILSRVALYLDEGSLRKKITATSLADKFRSGAAFRQRTIDDIEAVIRLLGEGKGLVRASAIHLNKATAQSWLLFLAVVNRELGSKLTAEIAVSYLSTFEEHRGLASMGLLELADGTERSDFATRLFNAYEDRSTSRVADVVSVQVRDLVLWAYFLLTEKRAVGDPATFSTPHLRELEQKLAQHPSAVSFDPEKEVVALKWGERL